jgi:1-acyl-sn-glycerol-3-phosphate acyltransferase
LRSPPRRGPREPGYWLAKTLLIPWLGSSFKWHFEGTEHLPKEGPALVAANHISFFDPLALAYTIHKHGRRPRFLAKGSLFKAPFVGWVLRTAKQISVARGTESARSSLEEAEGALRAGEFVVIFPEGTTTIADDLAPAEGKTGVARVALGTGLPVIPCATWGGQWVWSYHKGFKPGFGKEIWVRIGPPISFEEYAGREEDPEAWRSVSKLVMEEIAVLLAGLKAAKPWQPTPLPERTRRKLKEKGRL